MHGRTERDTGDRTIRGMCSKSRRFNRLEDGAKDFFGVLLRCGRRWRQERIFN